MASGFFSAADDAGYEAALAIEHSVAGEINDGFVGFLLGDRLRLEAELELARQAAEKVNDENTRLRIQMEMRDEEIKRLKSKRGRSDHLGLELPNASTHTQSS
ncbi:hypothetical protein KFL_012170040 [Klebsormidium nitens]|uniref:Uncharacterized protein n=1 Tax=Klebsormidium nitens TaxID=105231 RepID=A0A1Y1IXD6_KLENI|nr:hypothetical protein KFL_012170040 [Klebsormidium nitens]|eukprot:GAQ92948.1 hypothetical protein KFL_012170040 [Klebsormidium nitens]